MPKDVEITCTGNPSNPDWLAALERAGHIWTAIKESAAKENRELFPEGCGLCGEPADAEMGEFWDPAGNGGQGKAL
jgi:hypothetical protein